MGPYHAIHVGAAASTVPDALVEQLARPGRLIIPVDNPKGSGQYVTYFDLWELWQIDKDTDGKVVRKKLFDVMVRTFSDTVCASYGCCIAMGAIDALFVHSSDMLEELIIHLMDTPQPPLIWPISSLHKRQRRRWIRTLFCRWQHG